MACPVVDPFAKHFDHSGFDVRFDQRARRPFDDNAAMIEDGETVGEPLGFVHEMRGQHDGLAVRDQPAQALPDQMARLRVQPGGGFVEKQDVGIVHQRAGKGEPPFHAARQLGDLASALCARPANSSSMGTRATMADFLHAEITAVGEQVFVHAEIGIEVVDLRHHADLHPGLACVTRHRNAGQLDAAAVGFDQSQQQSQRRGLARAVRAQQAEAFAAPNRQVEVAYDSVSPYFLLRPRTLSMGRPR